MATPFFEDVDIGGEIPPLGKTPGNLQLFMFSAATWNCHRIHFDADFAREHDKLPNVLTHRPLLGSFLCQLLTDWLGDNGRIVRLEWSNRGPAVPGDTLTCRGKVTSTHVESKSWRVRLRSCWHAAAADAAVAVIVRRHHPGTCRTLTRIQRITRRRSAGD
jgi:hydroxyacyl-ACP dehydratase HTD2-like protein with hotdog domain